MNSSIKAIKDYIIEVTGNDKYNLNQVYEFTNKQIGIVIRASGNDAYLIFDGQTKSLRVGDSCEPWNKEFMVNTQSKYFGTIIDIYGNLFYGNPINENNQIYPNVSSVFCEAKNINYRMNLDTPFLTGIFSIDMFFPIGLGQRQAILGNGQSGKTSICLTTIINHKKNNNMKIVYVSIGNKLIDLRNTYNTLAKHKALNNVIMIHAQSDNALQQYLAPYVGMNHAENLMNAGFDVLIIFDNLTNHSNIIREMGLLTNTPVGREAHAGNLFYLHSQLLERGGKFINNKSITCFPIVKVINDDITGLLSSNIISITDGQIILSSELKNKGILPAINLATSVSRLGAAVQSPALRKMSSKLNRIYNLYNKNAKFNQMKFDFNDYIKKILQQGELMIAVLKQSEFRGYCEITNFLLGLIVQWNLLEPSDDIKNYIWYLQKYMEKDYGGRIVYNVIMNQINKKNQINDVILKEVILNVLEQYKFIDQDINKVVFNNSNKFKLSPKSLSLIKDALWVG